MKITTWFGTLDAESEEVSLGGRSDEMAERLMGISEDEASSGFEGQGVSVRGEGGVVQLDLRAIALEGGLFRDDEEYNAALRSTALDLVRKKLRASAGAEAELLQTIEALDDLNEVINRLEERLYEWSRLSDDRRLRGRALAESLSGEEGSIGILARSVRELYEARESVQMSLETATAQIAPNLSNLAGPLIAARMISRAGGLKRLSEMPASAIQVMGAEKALFKHLRGKAPSPKHGMIYRHPAVMGTTRRLRGRAARALAAKLAIAARIDRYSGELNPNLKLVLERRIDEIKNSPLGKRRKRRPGR
ncbi:MAG: ATP-binding protein [Methanothrix sp.]|jgi:nucleolar protein 56|uniref:Putative snoRNA binding domain protein n=1 Tax=Methanothrix harundinacea TaxID=301375 RepID=A0A101IK04_9EURY|nr:MAG: Putative snoRNA binding domain protein [Methanothrix harundinacea]MDD3709847.1 ATP-binding protein [Methanothrix sp.]MDI9400099.1 ATP-binding protein [Euryarchaeota archaeon]KUK96691.1 MAG: Putative snoRNA binding domain protein [Methanothrix harundinacea]MCP1391987.1 ATP-binding protein [Methanothrix harundinacea]